MDHAANAGDRETNRGHHRSNDQPFQGDIEINPMAFLRQLKRQRLLIAAVVLGAMTITAVVMVLTPNRYRSHASILPSGGRDQLSGLMEMAGQFGVGAMGAADENSSSLYPSILRSDLVRDGVWQRKYQIEDGRDSRSIRLDDYFETEDPSELRAALSRITSISEDKKLGIINLSVETTYPDLSQAVLRENLTQLETYLRFKRRSQARENEAYLVRQQKARGRELTQAEDSLQQFMQVNRNWNSSSDPQLQTELARFKREVEVRAKTYLLLTQQLELARLEVQKDIPIVRILDEPSRPTVKSGPRRTFTTLLVGCLTLLFFVTCLFVRDIFRQMISSEGHETSAGRLSGNLNTRIGTSRPLTLKNRAGSETNSSRAVKQPIANE
ncbi:MAG: Wzz/FepE/Etk N-terminal domain-containing protein [candidate division Zixibacteria bacterium]|nr:Wzz/FepE/Etk N-terminal domain-containing protein [candidate division Zixibacteria bacterium]MDH3938850.1 Wzz/FepE/Etk N-terminal domain-containing protein [candidate division Zixibacteria bacterium]MDH4033809.1 Wzz/FepE/Etk N-terminal domain-containing protein [candidate division Zixibacteria bacterium]